MKQYTFEFGPEKILRKCKKLPRPHSHIAIRRPGTAMKVPACGGPTLYLDFYDAGEKAAKKLRRGLFSEIHARAIQYFVDKSPDGSLIVVNCKAGVSRSAGVVLALRRHYGGDTEDVFNRSTPNIYVASILGRVLRESSCKR